MKIIFFWQLKLLTASVNSKIGVLGVAGAVGGWGVPNGVFGSLSTGVEAIGDNKVRLVDESGEVYH